METHEKIYIGCSIFQFIWFLFILTNLPNYFIGGHDGTEFFKFIFFIFSFILVFWGVSLIFKARKRKEKFRVLIVATLMACSYVFIIWGRYDYAIRVTF